MEVVYDLVLIFSIHKQTCRMVMLSLEKKWDSCINGGTNGALWSKAEADRLEQRLAVSLLKNDQESFVYSP